VTLEGRKMALDRILIVGCARITSEAVEPPREEDWPAHRDRANPAVLRAVRECRDRGVPLHTWPRNARLWVSTSSPLRLDRARLTMQLQEARSRLGLRDLLGPWGRPAEPKPNVHLLMPKRL